jgi:Kunitz/Bovine pancreatic trypsin inhibitor domain/Uncharacterized protein conserved in bacteria (DUF2330)
MSKYTGALAGLLTSLLFVSTAFADMGMVYVSTSGVTVSESAQKAIILHNNREEVLILGTELSANRQTPIVRFIPFPSEPAVSLAPNDTFQHLAAIVAKYRLRYAHKFYSKGPGAGWRGEDVEVRLSARLGDHDLTVIKVRDAAAFRSWVNDYFRKKGWPRSSAYPKQEAVVTDYVARGIDYFVLDAVEATKDKHLVDPVVYRFKTDALYYPLKTSNTVGGNGEIELFIVSPATLCLPGSNTITNEFDQAVGPNGRAAGSCLGLPVKASTSAMLVPQEQDLQPIYPAWAEFFGKQPAFIQSIRYVGKYDFKDDILVPLPRGVAKALNAEQSENIMDRFNPPLAPEYSAACRKKPDRGPCKGMFEAYYFDGNSHSCKMFIWGGCQGEVPFQSLKDCQSTCLLPLPKR